MDVVEPRIGEKVLCCAHYKEIIQAGGEHGAYFGEGVNDMYHAEGLLLKSAKDGKEIRIHHVLLCNECIKDPIGSMEKGPLGVITKGAIN